MWQQVPVRTTQQNKKLNGKNIFFQQSAQLLWVYLAVLNVRRLKWLVEIVEMFAEIEKERIWQGENSTNGE